MAKLLLKHNQEYLTPSVVNKRLVMLRYHFSILILNYFDSFMSMCVDLVNS